MSMSYWMCEGIGVELNSFYGRIKKDKVIALLKELFPKNDDVEKDFEDNDIEGFYDQAGYCEMLANLDEMNTLGYSFNGDEHYYLLYPRKYPWEITSNDPETLQEVHERIIKVLQMITDMSAEEIEKIIDDNIYEMGCG